MTRSKHNTMDGLMRYANYLGFGNLSIKIDHKTGLQAIVAIHSTKLGPAIGGCRMLHYASTEKAIEDAKLHKLDLNDRQKKAVEYIKEKGLISRKVYVEITGISLRQANDDISDLLGKKVLKRVGSGSLIRYQFAD